MNNVEKGVLKLTEINGSQSRMTFINKEGKEYHMCADLEGLRKWFCSSNEEQARAGVPATWNGSTLWTDEWHLRCASDSMAGYSQLSFHFC